MTECSLSGESRDKRVNEFGSCPKIVVENCVFEHCFHTGEGAAIFVSFNGIIELNEVLFIHCATGSVAGALSCRASAGSFRRSCFNDCCSLAGYSASSDQNVFHAAKIRGTSSTSEMKMTLSGAFHCPKDQISADETIGFRDYSRVLSKENNISHNLLAANEVFVIFDQCTLLSPVKYCSFTNCTGGWLLSVICPATWENCNFYRNKQTNRVYMINNEGRFTCKECVFDSNDYKNMFTRSGYDVSASFFCSNTFLNPSSNGCIRLNFPKGVIIENCNTRSKSFSVINSVSLSIICFIKMPVVAE